MSKVEDWENDLEWDDDQSGSKNNNGKNNNNSDDGDDDDDWENMDVDNLKDEEEEKKKKQAEEKKRLELEKERQEKERKKREEEKKKKATTRTVGGGAGTGAAVTIREKSGMMQAYAAQSGDFDETLDLLEGAQKPRIEILHPKDKKDFDEFSEIVSDKLLESCSNEHYVYFMKSLIDKCSNPLTADEMKEIQKLVNSLVTKKQVQEKEAKKLLPQATKKASKRTVHVDDPFADLGNPTSGGTAYNDDDDFM